MRRLFAVSCNTLGIPSTEDRFPNKQWAKRLRDQLNDEQAKKKGKTKVYRVVPAEDHWRWEQ